MTRKQAEKYANAIRLVAERDKSEWRTTKITTMDVGDVLKQHPTVVESTLEQFQVMIWGCLPLGWNLRRLGVTGLEISRHPRAKGGAS